MTEERKGIQSEPIEIISSERDILLRQFTPNDAKDVFELIDRNRKHLSQHGDDTADKYPSEEAVLRSITNPPNPNKLRFGIRDIQNILLGSINLRPDEETPGTGEIGYYLGLEFTRQGIMTKAVEALTTFAFEQLGYKTLYGDVHKDNLASINVLRRAGYKKGGVAEKEDFLRFSIVKT